MTYYGTLWDKDCHISPHRVMTIGQCTIYAGRWVDMNVKLDWDLRIRLNDPQTLGSGMDSVRGDAAATALLGKELTSVIPPPTLDVNWEDFQTPSVEKDWWYRLVEKLESFETPMNIGLYCWGGHGRTGTALAILAELAGIIPNTYVHDAVQWVRDNYCEDAVETWTQIDYVASVTGEYIDSQPSNILKSRRGNGNGAWTTSWNNPTNVKKIEGSNAEDSGTTSVTAETVKALARP